MTIAPGTRLGPYEITERIGTGGMGEVYRASDTKLGREVAIKTLPSALASDPERLARFEREAKLLATLNHAHIAAIYGLDEEHGTSFLAMELVAGETLEAKLEGGALPVEEALPIALQIAQALEAAHEKGVVHRDLKPANIMVTPGGVVKVLDFGLAKAFSGDPSEASPAHSPALSLAMTQAGLILGTAGYMSPEQASGQATDQRADIWAFGVVVYEMLTGLPLFSGESVPHILADVLRSEPDWDRLPRNLHARLKLMLERCLEKKVHSRYHAIADARVDIEAVLNDPEGAAASNSGSIPSRRSIVMPVAVAVVVTAMVGGIVAYAFWRPAPEAERAVTRFSFPLEGRLSRDDALALSPDGGRIVYSVNGQLYTRRLDQDAMTALPGTEDGVHPFFSSDGESVAFFTNSQLKAVGFAGEVPRVLADIEPSRGIVGTWDDQGRIFFGQAGSFDLYAVSAVGGEPTIFAERGDYDDLDYPDVLPGGEWVIFSGSRTVGNWSGGDVLVQNVSTGERKVVLAGGHFARYLPTGHLVFARNGTLYAVAFDIEQLETRGEAVPVVQSIATDETGGFAMYAVATNGTLIYEPGVSEGRGRAAVVQVDREGRSRAVTREFGDYRRPRVSPDGRRIAVEVTDSTSATHIWVIDIATGSGAQLTFEGTENRYAIWAPDGGDVFFTSNRNGEYAIYRKPADGTGDATRVLPGSNVLIPTDVTPEGTLVYQDASEDGDRDILLFDLESGDAPRPFLATPADEGRARISSDGRWMVYVSDESGVLRAYARPHPPAEGGRRAISAGPASAPTWSPGGDEIYFIGPPPGPLMAVGLETSDNTIVPAAPRELFGFVFSYEIPGLTDSFPYDVMPDGGFVAVQRAEILEAQEAGEADADSTLNVVLNWFAELERLVPTD
jgi:serine/threonine protein kinase